MELLIVLVMLGLFALASLRWGYDSRESIDSPEWEKRLAPPFVGKSKTPLRYDSSSWNEWEKRLAPPFAGYR